MDKIKTVYQFALILLIIFLLGCKNKNVKALEVPDRIDKAIKNRIKENFEKKVYLAKVSLNKPTQYKFYSDGGNEMTSIKDRFEIGSVTKTFTSLIIYELHKKGAISYEDKIVNYLPDSLLSTSGIEQIKIKHLLNHTSGLPWFPENYEITVEPWNNPFKNFDVNLLMGYVKSFTFPQKRKFQYSNMGYGLLTFIIEDITNKSFVDCVDELIIKDLRTDWDIRNKTTISGFDWNMQANNWDFPSYNYGIGGLRGSIEDIAAYGEYMLNLIDSDTSYLNLIFSDTIEFEQPFFHKIGRGWYKKINKEDNQEFIFHGGWTGGFNSHITLDIKKKEGLIVLSNTSSFVDDIGINYFDSTFVIRQRSKDFSWILSEELEKGVDVKIALNSINKKDLNTNRLLEFSRYLSYNDIEKSILINEFIIELEPENWIVVFEQGKYYALKDKYHKAGLLFENAKELGGNPQIIKKSQTQKPPAASYCSYAGPFATSKKEIQQQRIIEKIRLHYNNNLNQNYEN